MVDNEEWPKEWNDLGGPVERANLRLIIELTSYLIGAGVISLENVIESLSESANTIDDPKERRIYEIIVAALKTRLPPTFQVIEGGREE